MFGVRVYATCTSCALGPVNLRGVPLLTFGGSMIMVKFGRGLFDEDLPGFFKAPGEVEPSFGAVSL